VFKLVDQSIEHRCYNHNCLDAGDNISHFHDNESCCNVHGGRPAQDAKTKVMRTGRL
jgi:hypothetical protein